MQPQQPLAPQTPPAQPNYDFIMDPQKPAKPSLMSGTSLKQRLIVAAGGLLILIILASVVMSALSSSSDYYPSVLAVVQQQQEILHITQTVAQTQTKLATANANLSVTLQLTISSSQRDLLTYLQKNGHKVSTSLLNQKVSTAVDQQLNSAVQAGTYDTAFVGIIQNQLGSYQQYLQTALVKDKGPNGQKLLSDDLQQTKLLLAALTPNPQT